MSCTSDSLELWRLWGPMRFATVLLCCCWWVTNSACKSASQFAADPGRLGYHWIRGKLKTQHRAHPERTCAELPSILIHVKVAAPRCQTLSSCKCCTCTVRTSAFLPSPGRMKGSPTFISDLETDNLPDWLIFPDVATSRVDHIESCCIPYFQPHFQYRGTGK